MRSENSTYYDISVIITAHSEGRLAHRSVKSAQAAIHWAQKHGIKLEFIAVLDCACPETLAYFEEQREIFNQVSRVDFRDPGLSRNHGVELSSGRYVAFLDAGDLFSENWLASAFQFALADATHALVLHPEANLFFGRELFLLSSISSNDPGYSPLELIEFNPWTALNFVSRSFFLDGNQYHPVKPGSGFGHEDWHWNCEAIANEAIHRLVPKTVHFIRLRDDSLPQRPFHSREVFLPSKLFDDSSAYMFGPGAHGYVSSEREPILSASDMTIQSRSDTSNQDSYPGSAKTQVKRSFSFFFRQIRKPALGLAAGRPRLKHFFLEIEAATERLLASPLPPLDCDWLIAPWRRIHQIEPELFPSRETIARLDKRVLPKSAIASYYPELSRLVGPSPTHLYLVPWLKRGGSDIGAIHYMTAVAEENPASRVVCVTTENADSPWSDKLPEKVRVVELGKLLLGLSEDEQATLLLRLLLQKSPQVIHNIHSRLGFKIFHRNGAALAAESRLFASAFCEDITPEGRTVGYAFDWLPQVMRHLSGVLTDNQRIIDKLYDLYALERNKFSLLYFPATGELKSQKITSHSGPLQILWAGRIDRQKRPDVLIKIASALTAFPAHFHVYGAPLLDPQGLRQFQYLKELPNVTTYGHYDGFESIPAAEYDLFLYTSQWDGMPNVLLEATTAGLPVIAPDVGGIRELVNDDTGFLVSHADALDEYVGYIKKIQARYEIVSPKLEAARALIKTRHSWNTFVYNLRQVDGYFPETGFTPLPLQPIQ